MNEASARARDARHSAALFVRDDRALIAVRGTDARRWLNGMLSNDVAVLDAAGAHSGCHALVLTRQGRVVADVLVVARAADVFWLELACEASELTLQHLQKTIVADDVTLSDESAGFACLQLEGPRSTDVLAGAVDDANRDALDACPPNAAKNLHVVGAEVVAIAHGESGEVAWRLLVPRASKSDVLARLRDVGRAHRLLDADAATLDVLRVEAGTPRFGSELTAEVLPAEARLDERAVSFTKGCYTGQEIVARMRSRGSVSHLLVGLIVQGDMLPASQTPLTADGRVVGELTSAVRSASVGVIALGFVRRPHDAVGTRLDAAGVGVSVCALPFIAASPAASR